MELPGENITVANAAADVNMLTMYEVQSFFFFTAAM